MQSAQHPAPGPRRSGTAHGILLAILVAFLAHAFYLNCIAEDAFISLRFAGNLASGHGLVWNVGGLPVEGYTDFLWVVICAGAMRLGIEGVAFAHALSLLSGVAVLIGTYAAGRALGWPSRIAAVAPAFLACAGPIATWSTSGMEMPLFAALVVWSAVLLSSFQHGGRRLSLGGLALLLFLATLTRPEGVLVALLIFAFGIVVASVPRDRFAVGGAAALYAIGFAAYWTWRYHHFGYPFPNTFYAKTGGGLPQIVRGAMLAFIFYMQFVVPLLPWSLVVLWAAPPDVRRLTIQDAISTIRAHSLLALSIVLAAGYTAYTILVGGDYMAMHRFYVPVLPFVYLLVGGCAYVLSRQPGNHRAGLAALFVLTLSATVFPSTRLERGFFATPPVQHGDWRGVQLERWHVARLTVIGKFFRTYRRTYDESLATSAIGAIGYYADMRVDDVLGLVDPYIAHLPAPADFAEHRPGHGRSDLAYSFERRPTYFMLSRDLTPAPADVSRFIPDALRQVVSENYIPQSVWLTDPVNGESGYFTFLERRDSAAARTSPPTGHGRS